MTLPNQDFSSFASNPLMGGFKYSQQVNVENWVLELYFEELGDFGVEPKIRIIDSASREVVAEITGNNTANMVLHSVLLFTLFQQGKEEIDMSAITASIVPSIAEAVQTITQHVNESMG